MKDEILEKMAAQPRGSVAHDFDGAEAVGQWVVCERTGAQEHTRGGLIVPEASQIPIWTVVSAGAGVEEAVGRKLEPGERLLFANPTATLALDGRGFALLRANEIVAVLRIPDAADAPRIITAASNGASVLQ